MRALTLPAEEAEELDRLGVGGAEPVRDASVELGRFAGCQHEVVLAEDEPQPSVEDVEPFVALVCLRLGFFTRAAGREDKLVCLDAAGPAGQGRELEGRSAGAGRGLAWLSFVSEEFDKAYWEERYRSRTAGRRRPNSHLVAEAEELVPGVALDAGCGEGADAIWLASRGWRVTAVDIATTALRRAREHAETLGAEVASRIDWIQADLTSWTPAEERFDLVSALYVHTAAPRESLVRRLAASVAPGGTLLIVGHHPSHPQTGVSHAAAPEVHFTAEEVAASLDPDRWDVAVAEARARSTTRDAVLRARKTR